MTITQGDTRTFTVTVTDENDAVVDLSGYTMTFTVKDSVNDIDANAFIQEDATISTPASGIGSFTLAPSDTNITVGDYWYDVQISDGSTNVYTVIETTRFTIASQVTIDI